MKWKKVFGWTLFACGILGGLYVLMPTILLLLQTMGSLLEVIGSARGWGLIGAGIVAGYGWWLVHSGKTKQEPQTDAVEEYLSRLGAGDIPADEDEEDEDEDKEPLSISMSIAELEQLKATYKDNPSVCKIINGYIEAKRRQEAQE